MPEFSPLAFAPLVRRLFLELEREGKIYDLAASKFWRGPADPRLNMGVRFHGVPAGTPLGPAAGPHTQLAQNIVLSWLGGCRIMELKTVQIDDRLVIPRPCIDATNVGYNIEFSQELRLEQSLDEYVKAWMLIRMLEEAEVLGVPRRIVQTGAASLPHFYDCVFDLSCGYNLEGIRSERLQWFIRSMKDASETISRLRAEIPEEFARFRDIDYDPHIVSTATLSTFHGCPADEIEKIVDYLIRQNGLLTVIKMNPTMLGGERLNEILHQNFGYDEIAVNPAALTSGLQFEDSIAMTRRLRRTAHEHGLRVGAKFNNTLEVLNHKDFFATEKVMYMSGAPLHPIAVELALKYREAYLQTCSQPEEKEAEEDGFVPISFSAGVDKTNFPAAVACGFVPITTCTDLLKPGGYARLFEYLKSLEAEMGRAGATTVDEFVVKYANAGDLSLAAASLANHTATAEAVVRDPRYSKAKNSLIPKRINSHLTVFDCITCDKCIPVCPNDANFTYTTPDARFEYRNYILREEGLIPADGEPLVLELKKARQIANFGPFCNECGNCDTFCPEYGGPFIEKPTFFANLEEWNEFHKFDGFCISVNGPDETIYGRMQGVEYSLIRSNGEHTFSCPAGVISIDPTRIEPSRVIEQREQGLVDLHIYLTLRVLLDGVLHDQKLNYINIQASPGQTSV